MDVLMVEVPKLPAEVAREYQRLLGTDWNKLRLAVQGKHVVLLIGSDVERLEETLRNLKTGTKGLATNNSVTTALGRLAAERKLEFHINFKAYQAFLANQQKKEGRASLASFALTIEADRMQLEVRAPSADAKAVVRLLGMAAE